MIRRRLGLMLCCAALVSAGLLCGPRFVRGQGTPAQADASRFEFVVIESYDAKYLGDRPGHMGRGGGLGRTVPNVALGDRVYNKDREVVGSITHVEWDRTKESLEVEFDPAPLARVAVGQTVWISLRGPEGK